MELVWDEVYENERYNLRKGWKECPQISKLDPNHWTSKTYQKMHGRLDIRLPPSDSDNRWVWVDEWKSEPWLYAISFGSAIGSFSFSEKRKKNHFVRRRKWKRPRIRKIEVGTTTIVERVYENQRIFLAKAWKSPYMPGDRPHYSNALGKNLTMKQVESRLPPQWTWTDEWSADVGEHTDKEGWEYTIDFLVGGWTPNYKLLQHCVRRKCWVRTRKLAGQVRETKKLQSVAPTYRSGTKSISPETLSSNRRRGHSTTAPSGDQKLKQMVIDSDDIALSDGWGSSDDGGVMTGTMFMNSGVNSVHKFYGIHSMLKSILCP